MIFIIVWFLDHFTPKYTPSMNSIWIITPTSLFHARETKFKASIIFFNQPILTSNNVVWVSFFAVLFAEAQHVVKISTTEYVPDFYEVINLFIKFHNFLLMFFICKLKGLYLIIFLFNGLLMVSLDLFNPCIKPAWHNVFQDMLFKCFTLFFSRIYNGIHGPKE